jgi:hypothetical protein
MFKHGIKLVTATVILFVVFGTMAQLVPKAQAAGTNVIQNPGFELSTAWTARYSTFLGSYAKVQDSAYKHTGSYSGLTQTTNPKQEFCDAELYQTLNIGVQGLGAFYYWILKGSSAPNGYDTGDACIYMTGGYTLVYYHGFDSSSPPADGTTWKYINAGNPPIGTWTQVSRNLRTDLVNKFGSGILTQNVSEIALYSHGWMDLETKYKYGQRVNWDDIYMEGNPLNYTVSLTSATLDGKTNVGNITLAGITYTLPNSVQKPAGSYSATGNAPFNYKFDHWEVSGGINVSNPNSQTTTVTVSNSGTLKAVFQKKPWTFMVYLDADNSLDWYGPFNVNQMETVGSTSNVAIIVQMDRLGLPAKRYYITKDNDTGTINSPVIQDIGEVNMGNPTTLVNFIEWTMTNYPAERYALVMWDHGGGYEGVCWDDTSGGDYLTMSELKSALNTVKTDTGAVIDVIGFDACLMAQVEVAYQIRGLVQVFVASEETIAGDGWPYHWVVGNLTAYPAMSAQQLGTQIVVSYGDYYGSAAYGNDPMATMSAIYMSPIEGMARSMSDLGSWLSAHLSTYRADITWARQNVYEYYYRSTDFVDTYHLAQLLSQRISDASFQRACQNVEGNITSTVFSEWHGSSATNSHGLSVYFADSNYDATYNTLDMSVTYLWDDFVRQYLGI